MIFLVVIGEGERHSDESTYTALELADLKTIGDDGVNVQIYKMQGLTFLAVFGFAWLFFPFAWLRSLMTDRHLNRLARQVWRTTQAVGQVEAGTAAIQEAGARMDEQTTRMQRLAITIGVVTGLVGAVLGGFAGAFAAHVIG